jgi:hypothetical protein
LDVDEKRGRKSERGHAKSPYLSLIFVSIQIMKSLRDVRRAIEANRHDEPYHVFLSADLADRHFSSRTSAACCTSGPGLWVADLGRACARTPADAAGGQAG